MKKWLIIIATVLPTLAFLAAGTFKLSGAEEMVLNFQKYGLPVSFMYFIGLSEVAGAIGLWLRIAPVGGIQLRLLAALGLGIIMVGAIANHVIHDPIGMAAPAAVLLVILLFLAHTFRKDSLGSHNSEFGTEAA
jgi:hypothetical protein